MKNSFEKWQIISIISRFGAQIIGTLQWYLVALILPAPSYGLYSIVSGIAKSFGSYQNLGLQSTSNREIAAAKDLSHAFKVFFVVATFRYFISIPLAILLFVKSTAISSQFDSDHTRIVFALKVYAFIILFQAIQGIFNTVLAGLKKFKILFSYQFLFTIVSFIISIPLVYFFDFEGTITSILITTIVSVIILGYFAIKSFEGNFTLPTFAEYKFILKDILSLSLSVYIVKVIFSNWENLGKAIIGTSFILALLGDKASLQLVGVFGIALAYSAKLMMISDSITDVNMTIFTEKYLNDIKNFASDFLSNFSKIFITTTFVSISVLFWNKEVFDFIFRNKYAGAEKYVPVLVIAYWAYSFINIYKASIYVPAKRLLLLVVGFLLLLITSIVSFIGFRLLNIFDVTLSLSVAMMIGSLITYLFMTFDLRIKFKVWFINTQMLITFSFSLFMCLIYFYNLQLNFKLLMFVLYFAIQMYLMLKWKVIKVPAKKSSSPV